MTDTEELSAEKARDDFERGGRDEALYALLTPEGAACFDVRGEWLKRCGFYDPKNVYRNFLLFPHPSGINAWWNSDFNRFRAKRALREFVFSETLATIP